jgi:undecaprenyl diphosphate synthase
VNLSRIGSRRVVSPELGDVAESPRMPQHVGIIMDGNGRWAQERGKPRSEGHLEGMKAAKRVVQAAAAAGLRYISLFTFSTENWSRAAEEISYLMFLIRSNLAKEFDFYRKNNIKILHSGDLERLPTDIVEEITSVVSDTAAFTGLTLNLCINYGGRDEIVRAIARHRKRAGGTEITEEGLNSCLDHPEIPDPDLIIRTSGEKRISNFLLWSSAYSELYFSPKYWPDWTGEDLREALEEYAHRKRRFGRES